MMPYDDDFPTCKETYSSLRIFSNEIQPAEITELLGIAPSYFFTKDEPYGRRFIRQSNGWFLSSEKAVDSKDTRRHIDWIITQVHKKDIELADLRRRGVEVDILSMWISKGQGGPLLSPAQMKVLVRLDLDVWWDIYFSS